jgi:hypothetical protein
MKKIAGVALLVMVTTAWCFARNVDTVILRGDMSPANEVPAVTGLTANGSATIRVHTTTDGGKITGGVVDFVINYSFGGAVNITGLHIHEAAAGVNGGIVIPTDLSAAKPINFGGGSGFVFKQVVVTDTALRGRLLANPAGFYVNMHTTDNPGGVMRSQLQVPDAILLRTTLAPTNEAPAITNLDCSGSASISAFADRDASGKIIGGSVDFNVNYRFPGGPSWAQSLSTVLRAKASCPGCMAVGFSKWLSDTSAREG